MKKVVRIVGKIKAGVGGIKIQYADGTVETVGVNEFISLAKKEAE